MKTIIITSPAERKLLARMANATPDFIPEEGVVSYPVMGFRAMGDLRVAKSLMDKGLLAHLGNHPQPRFRMTDAGVATQTAPTHWGQA